MMNILFFIFICIIELFFCIASFIRKPLRRDWNLARVIVDAGEVILLFVMMLLPGISFGLRFNALIALLVIRLIFAVIKYLWVRIRKERRKTRIGMAASFLLSGLLVFIGLVPSVIFADYQGLPVTGSHPVAMTHAILIDENREETFETDGSKREVPVYLYYPEDADGSEKYPVVFFSHGAFGYYQSNTSTYMELASHGYVIISMEHPYHSLFTKDSAGELVIANQDFLSGVMGVNEENVTEAQIYEDSRPWINLRVEDANFAVDAVKDSVKSKELTWQWFASEEERPVVASVMNLIDENRIGFMGHSLGGATAVSLGRTRDDICAVVDIDGTMLSEMLGVKDETYLCSEEAYQVPLLCFDNTDSYQEMKSLQETGIPYVNNIVLENALAGFQTTIDGTGHMNYTDLPMFAPPLAKILGIGEVEPAACMIKVNQIILEFFDCYLKGEGTFSVAESYAINQGQ